MDVRIGTFNLNNLFSRFNFLADLDTGTATDVAVSSSIGSTGSSAGAAALGAGGGANQSTAVYAFGDGSLVVKR